MRASFLRSWIGAAALVWIAAATSCTAVRETSVRAGSVRIHRVTRANSMASRRRLDAQVGDWVLANRGVEFVVGGMSRPPRERGVVLEAQAVGSTEDESLARIEPSVYVEKRRFRIVVRDIVAIMRDGKPLLRVVGDVEVPGGEKLVLIREFGLSPRIGALGISSSLHRSERGTRDVRLGERVAWGGRDPFLPGVGAMIDESFHRAGFVGTSGDDEGIVIGHARGTVRVGAKFEVHGNHRFLQHTDVTGSMQQLRRGRPAIAHEFVVVASRGMGVAARQLGWLRGEHFAEAAVTLPYSPRGALVRVSTPDGRPLIAVRPGANGRAVVPLPVVGEHPAGRFIAVASADGHADSEPVVFAPRAHVWLEIPRGGRVRIRVRDAATHGVLSARVRFLPLARGTSVALGPDWAASGAGDSLVIRGKELSVPLVPGRYRVLVSHGPEWTLHDQVVEVTDTFRPDVRATLVHVVDPGDWVACDTHVHAAPSPDSQVSLADRVASLVAEGVGFAVPTDHNHVTDYGPAARALGLADQTFLTTSGVEATTSDPHYGHFNAYPIPYDENALAGGAPPFSKVPAAELFASLRARSPHTTIQVNHPRLEGGIGYFEAMGYDPATGIATGPYSSDYDVLEVWNGFDLARKAAFDQVFGEWLMMVARGRRVAAVGSSDSHAVRYQWAGYPRTYARAATRDPLAIIDAIREGHSFVTSGPFLGATVGGMGPGDLAPVTNGIATVSVHVRTPAWMAVDRIEIWMNGTKMRDEPLVARPVRRRPRAGSLPVAIDYDAVLEVPATNDAGLVVLVRGAVPLDDFFGRAMIPPLAFSNPIWLDADGDGQGPTDPGDRGAASVAPPPPHHPPPPGPAAPAARPDAGPAERGVDRPRRTRAPR